ncbi:MAG: hypothetical protein HRT91_02760 [Piscirickettsiaceae bacterium]|nr:hypothetical protein [Piscirickettsiaceae bacterium]
MFLPTPGMHLTHPTIFLKCMQVVKQHILDKSDDKIVKYVSMRDRYKAKSETGRLWRPIRVLDAIEADLKWEEKYQPKSTQVLSQTMSLNNITFTTGTKKEQRGLITDRLKRNEIEAMRIRLFSLCRNGNFLTWDSIMDTDLTWKEMIFDLSEQVIAFRHNAISMSLPSMSNLRRWGIRRGGVCALCKQPTVTAAHVLSHCSTSLFGGRYTWRHDNVLACLANDFYGFASRANRSFRKSHNIPSIISFVKSGATTTKTQQSHTIFHKHPSDDWNVNIDLQNNPTIPPETNIDTLLRPDIVFFSLFNKVLLWGELTCPLERNMVDARLRKERRYNRLHKDLCLNGWNVYPMTFEIGDLGFISRTTHAFFAKVCDKSSQRKHMMKRASTVALRSSYYIWMSRSKPLFSPPTLVARPSSRTITQSSRQQKSQTTY